MSRQPPARRTWHRRRRLWCLVMLAPWVLLAVAWLPYPWWHAWRLAEAFIYPIGVPIALVFIIVCWCPATRTWAEYSQQRARRRDDAYNAAQQKLTSLPAFPGRRDTADLEWLQQHFDLIAECEEPDWP